MIGIERFSIDNDWLIIVFIIIATGLASLKFIDEKRFKSLVRLPIENFYLSSYANSSRDFFRWSNVIVYTLGLVFLSLMLLMILSHFKVISTIGFNGFSYLKVLIAVFIYFILKYFIEFTIAWILDLNAEYSDYAYAKLSYNFSFYLPVLLIGLPFFYFFKNSEYYFYFVLTFLGLGSLLRYLLSINILKQLIFSNLFYFILYLCSLEIAPFIYIYKWGFLL